MVKIEEFVDVCLAEDLKVMIDVSLPSNLSLEVVVDYVTTLFSKNPDLYSKAVVMSHWPHILFGKSWIVEDLPTTVILMIFFLLF